MNTFFGILLVAVSLAVVAQAAPSTDENCPTICASIWAPVCAHNGKCHKTFASECNLNANNCLNKDNEFTLKHNNECDALQENMCSISSVRQVKKVLKPKCNTICNLIYDPICAFNGSCHQTFPSQCVLESSNCVNADQAQFVQILKGECNAASQRIC